MTKLKNLLDIYAHFSRFSISLVGWYFKNLLPNIFSVIIIDLKYSYFAIKNKIYIFCTFRAQLILFSTFLIINFFNVAYSFIHCEDFIILAGPFFFLKKPVDIKNKYIQFIFRITLVFIFLLGVFSIFIEIYINFWLLSFFVYFYLTMLIYVLLYSWRNLEVSLGSLLTIYCNLLIFNLFILGLYKLSTGLPNPIYVEHLSEYSIYKYALYLFGILFGGLAYIILKNYFPAHLNKLDLLTFPYLKEEVRVFLYTWNESFFGPIFTSLIDFLYESSLVRYFYFTVHFVLFYFIRILQTLLFFNFVFFHGDLRWNIYLLPLSFFSWLLRFLEYYFNTFFKGGAEYIRSCLVVTLKNPLTRKKNPKAYFLNGNDLNFEITPFALFEGFQKDHEGTLVFLATQWLRFMHLLYFFTLYESKLTYISKFIFFFRMLSWFAITYINFLPTFIMLNGKYLIFFRSFYSSVPQLTREAYPILDKFKKQVELASEGAYKSPHPAIVDKEQQNERGEYLLEGGLTHGPGSKKNPSYEIHSKKDLKGEARNQSTTLTKKDVYIPGEALGPVIQGSRDFLEDPTVKSKLDAYKATMKSKNKDPDN
jgi:hypothetical protein